MKHHWHVLRRLLVRAALATVVLVTLTTESVRAQLEGTYQVAVKKQEEKKQSRWTLADWLTQKENNRLMDRWLAQNSHSSLFESYLEMKSVNYGQYNTATPDQVTNHNSYSGALAVYAGVAGLRGSYEGDNENRGIWTGSLNIRLLGKALQDTHINLEYGLRGLTLNTPGQPMETFQNQYGGVSLNLYLAKHFGLEGAYRKILPAQSDQKRTLQGESEEAGVFIDFGILRVFGEWRNEFSQYDGGAGPNPQPAANEIRSGYGGGLRIYF